MVNSRPPMGAAKAVATPTSQRKGCCRSCVKGREGTERVGVKEERGARGGEGKGKNMQFSSNLCTLDSTTLLRTVLGEPDMTQAQGNHPAQQV